MAKTPAEKCRKAMMALVIATGVTALYCLYIWICLLGYKPGCYLDRLDLPANSSAATFSLSLSNTRNKGTGVSYDPIKLTFSDKYNHSYNATVRGFHQFSGTVSKKSGTFKVNGTNSVFRVDMKTQIRYNCGIWKSRTRHRLEGGADVSLDAEGSLVSRHFLGLNLGVELTSGAGLLDGPGVLFRVLLLTAGVSFLS